MGLFRVLLRIVPAPAPPRSAAKALDRPIPREMRFPATPHSRRPAETLVKGSCWVIDGDTIVIDKMHIRLAGIDAPELDHPWGQQSKWALVKLCKGQVITARIKPEMSYERVVAECFLPDGRDLAAELVKVGLALDWATFSGGKYRALEPADARKKLWRTNLRQGGLASHVAAVSVPAPTRNAGHRHQWQRAIPVPPAAIQLPPPKVSFRFDWLAAFSVVMLVVGCGVMLIGANRPVPATRGASTPVLASYAVTAAVLNVRQEPAATSGVIAQVRQGTTVIPNQVSGNWYRIATPDGSMGWVHKDFLGPTHQ